MARAIVAQFPELKLNRTLWGSGIQIVFVSPVSCLLDIDFIQPPRPSLSSKGQIQTVANQGREGMQKQGRNSQMVVQPWGRVLLPPQGVCITISLSYSAGTKAPTQLKDGAPPRFLEHYPVTSLPTNQKKSHIPCSPHPKFCLLFWAGQ